MNRDVNEAALSKDYNVKGKARTISDFARILVQFDDAWTKKLAVCAENDFKTKSKTKSKTESNGNANVIELDIASIGRLRLLMVLLELSCHGVVWIVGIVSAILVTHQLVNHQKLLNLMISMILFIYF